MFSYWILTLRSLVLMGLVPILLGVLLLAATWHWRAERSAFVDNLRAVQGRILTFENSEEKLLVEIEYPDEQGVLHRKRVEAPRGQEPHMRKSGWVGIVYDHRDASHAEIGDITRANHDLYAAGAGVGAGGLVVLTGFYFALSRVLKILRIRRLFRTGAIVETEVRDQAMAPGNPKVGRFTYAFRGANGRWYDGRSPDLPPDMLSRWPVARVVRAVYDPADPKQNEPDLFGVLDSMKRVQ